MSLFDTFMENEYLRFLIILIIKVIAATLSFLVLKAIINKIAGRKKTYGKFIFQQISKPIFLIIFFVGLYIAIELLTSLDKYKFWIDGFFFILFTFIGAWLVSRILKVLMIGWLKVSKGFERTPGLLNKIVTVVSFIVAMLLFLNILKWI